MILTSFALVAALTAPQTTAYTSTAPIQVASCNVSQTQNQALLPDVPAAPSGSSLAISFVNQDQKTVKSVTFNVSGISIVDAGTFSTGTRINHEFDTPQLLGASSVTCNVESVAFADGSTWQAQ
jgi:hypothetical protein